MPVVSFAYRVNSGGIGSGSIGNSAVLSGNIASGSIGNYHLASGSVASGNIGNSAVVSGSIASGQIGIYHLASGILNQYNVYLFSGLTSNTVVYSGSINNGMSCVIDYAAKNILTSGYRAGTVTTIWDSAAGTTAYTETSTSDLTGTTVGMYFSTSLLSGNIQINANIDSGNFNLRINSRFV